MANNPLLAALQKLSSEYKQATSSKIKLEKMWDIGELLYKNNQLSQKFFWSAQKSGFYISRAILLRSYWFRTAFEKHEISSINVPISKLLSLLPYLAPNSKRFSMDQKNSLKIAILENRIPSINPIKRRSRERTKTSISMFNEIYLVIRELDDSEITIFKKNLSLSELEALKSSFFSLMRYDTPKEEDARVMEHAQRTSERLNLERLTKIFAIMSESLKKTKMDSKIILRKTFNPNLLMPLLDRLFFKKEL